MVNLLFISSNSNIDTIKNELQPLLKIKIDVAGDFDYGLKEVFEKRPALVFIQDQITGVTGESVARHILMLLGSDAPSFILMHEGNLKAKPTKGLYDFLIDLSQDVTKVVADIQSTLKLLLGPQWEKIYIAPQINNPVDTVGLAGPEEDRGSANKRRDVFASDLGNDYPRINKKDVPPDATAPGSASEELFQVVSSTQAQLEEIISETASEFIDNKTAAAAATDHVIPNIFATSEGAATSKQAPTVVAHDATAGSGDISATQTVSPAYKASVAPPSAAMPEKSPPSQISPADFRIGRERVASEDATKVAMSIFEANYLSKAAARKKYQAFAVVLLLCLIGGGWYLLNQKTSLKQYIAKESTQPIVPPQATTPAKTVPVVQKTVSTAQKSVPAALPSFIPLEGHDQAFTSQKPGWDRYVGKGSEYRVYRIAGKLKAVQVLATEGHIISESRLKTILLELTGIGEYRIKSREQKYGFQVSHAAVDQKADLLIYRKKSAVHAFVVSFD